VKCYLVCFDIQDDRTRRRVGKLLTRYGDRVQYSVFEVAFNRTADLDDVRHQAQDLLEPGDDIRFYYLNHEARQQSCDGTGQPVAQFPAAVIV